jgi:hypothetical protein
MLAAVEVEPTEGMMAKVTLFQLPSLQVAHLAITAPLGAQGAALVVALAPGLVLELQQPQTPAVVAVVAVAALQVFTVGQLALLEPQVATVALAL